MTVTKIIPAEELMRLVDHPSQHPTLKPMKTKDDWLKDAARLKQRIDQITDALAVLKGREERWETKLTQVRARICKALDQKERAERRLKKAAVHLVTL